MIANGWLDWATRQPGIPDKVYSESNRGFALVGHSIVGTPAAALGRFLSLQRNSDGQYSSYAAASVMFINPKAGPLIQMYPVTSSTWASGGRDANTSMWAIESEGGAPGNESEPLNDNQVANLIRLAHEFEAFTGRKVVRSRGEGLHAGDTFREHGEVATQYGYASTACPSKRYQRFYEALWAQEDGAMTKDETDRLTAERSLMQIAFGDGDRMNADYAALVASRLLEPEDGDDLNAYLIRRFRIAELANGPRATDAYKALGGSF